MLQLGVLSEFAASMPQLNSYSQMFTAKNRNLFSDAENALVTGTLEVGGENII